MIGCEHWEGDSLPLRKSQFQGGLEWPQRLPPCPHPSPRAPARAGSQRQGLRALPPTGTVLLVVAGCGTQP